MTTEQRINELLKPRFILIKSYPGNLHEIGTIIHNLGRGNLNKGKALETSFDNYPHLFKKLEWWEHRKLEEMPEYVKKNDDVLLVNKYDFDSNTVYVEVNYPFSLRSFLNKSMPSTLEEYTTYINSKQ